MSHDAERPEADLALALAAPPASLDARLRALAADLRPEHVLVRAAGGLWADTAVPGLRCKALLRDARDRRQTLLARYAPGTVHPAHLHDGVEEVFVLEGDAVVQGRAMGPEDFCAAEAGTIHRPVTTREGALFLVCHSPKDAPTAQPDEGERGIVFAMACDAAWRAGTSPGVRVRTLYRDEALGLVTAVVALDPGASLALGEGAWQAYMIRGASTLAGTSLDAGDFRYVARGGVLTASAPSAVLVVDVPAADLR